LVGDHNIARCIPYKLEVVEGGQNGFDVSRRGGEQGDVLDIGVVLRHVGDEVVHIVAGLPPADTKTAAKVCNEGTDKCVCDKVASDSTVAGVVCCEHDLLPEKTKEDGRGHIPLDVEETAKSSEKKTVSDRLFGILGVATLVQAFVLELLVK
jgi:hypothetical protein